MASETLLSAGIGLIGAVIGGSFTLVGAAVAWCSAQRAVEKQIEAQRRRDEGEAKRQARNILRVSLFNLESKISAAFYPFVMLTDREQRRESVKGYLQIAEFRTHFCGDTSFLDDDTFNILLIAERRLHTFDCQLREAIDKNRSIEELRNILLPASFYFDESFDEIKKIRKREKLEVSDPFYNEIAEAVIRKYPEVHRRESRGETLPPLEEPSEEEV